MKKMLNTSSTKDIQNFFFSSSVTRDLNIRKLTDNQIKKHSSILTHKNRTLLKNLFMSQNETGGKSQSLKKFQEQKTSYGKDEK